MTRVTRFSIRCLGCASDRVKEDHFFRNVLAEKKTSTMRPQANRAFIQATVRLGTDCVTPANHTRYAVVDAEGNLAAGRVEDSMLVHK